MKNIEELAGLIRSCGDPFYGAETPEYMAQQWVDEFPGVEFDELREWLDEGFWAPNIARKLSDLGVLPGEIPADGIYDMCNDNLSVIDFIKGY